MMKNKKGEMLGEYTLKTIIAVMCVLLLLYLLFSLYASLTEKKNFARAKDTLEGLVEKMNDAKSNNIETSIPLLEPNGWVVLSYTSGDVPDACSGNCVCLCQGIRIRDMWKLWWADNQVEKCNVRGVCQNIKDNIEDFNFKLRNEVTIKYDGEYKLTGVKI